MVWCPVKLSTITRSVRNLKVSGRAVWRRAAFESSGCCINYAAELCYCTSCEDNRATCGGASGTVLCCWQRKWSQLHLWVEYFTVHTEVWFLGPTVIFTTYRVLCLPWNLLNCIHFLRNPLRTTFLEALQRDSNLAVVSWYFVKGLLSLLNPSEGFF